MTPQPVVRRVEAVELPAPAIQPAPIAEEVPPGTVQAITDEAEAALLAHARSAPATYALAYDRDRSLVGAYVPAEDVDGAVLIILSP